ncbi:DUF397 domain-containing protein [Nonomuraea sp. PA05]|uniref:DUF397 domain-containing protein n=1 Tax=Nonomuraea sp. PA05 TaxID=2604466 RepID=UPI0011D38A71|nr:DUF397 domain-containing protein [Nonomuraea sp. PA05]
MTVSEVGWRRSATCTSNSTCVEVRPRNGRIVMRSTLSAYRELEFSPDDWEIFIADIKSGKYADLI